MHVDFTNRLFLVLALVGAIFVHGAEAGESHKHARLIVQRTPNFGTNLIVRLSIDGKKIADIPRDQHYGGFVAAGRHVLTVNVRPNTELRRPTSIRLTAQSGGLYIFTAAWESDRLILRRSTTYSPTTAVRADR